jgi:NAD(P)-dependent dehydrogenase (short-subunit alcohol dehydrogenase family)
MTEPGWHSACRGRATDPRWHGCSADSCESWKAFLASDLLRVDMRKGKDVSAWLAGLEDIDVVVNCVGVFRRGVEHDRASIAGSIDIKLTGTMRLSAAARAAFNPRKAWLVNTASMRSFIGDGRVPDDAAGVPEMITHCQLQGARNDLDEHGHTSGFEDVSRKIDLCRKACNAVGLGAYPVYQFVR